MSMRILTFCFIMMSFLGCAHKCGRIAFKSLPKSNTYYGAEDSYYPWTYYGSDDLYHYVLYSYNRGKFVRSREYKILRSQVALNDVELKAPSEEAICALIPFVNDRKEIISFDRDPSAKKVPDYEKPVRKRKLFANATFFRKKSSEQI